ncbi:orotidine-5'-phosphate decarboxylase [Burkholderiaceae bacterium FT117]|nr:orotidine-5'-phosphate decarboxylase [Zeimonas sediminis]MCM5570276.1 orotidine-5'-phosphate decarboxylase [Zeimonas sediminis]
MSFVLSLRQAWDRSQSTLCVGLDPDPAKIPVAAGDPDDPDTILRFCRGIVDATAPYACAFKPQIAYFAAARAEAQLEALVGHIHRAHPGIPVVLDTKRGDIGATAERYAIEAFDRYGADAVTVNPYMGFDSIEPWLRGRDRGVFLLCRTSNPGGSDLQALDVGGERLFERVARLAAGPWNLNGQLGLVVGATFPEELARVRELVGEMPLLVPGIGAQGGDIEATVAAGAGRASPGMLVNSSRAILYASTGPDWAEAAARVARETRDALRAAARR